MNTQFQPSSCVPFSAAAAAAAASPCLLRGNGGQGHPQVDLGCGVVLDHRGLQQSMSPSDLHPCLVHPVSPAHPFSVLYPDKYTGVSPCRLSMSPTGEGIVPFVICPTYIEKLSGQRPCST